MTKSLIIVPARLDSTRVEHKLLQKIGDETVIRRTCKRLETLCDIADIVVASDSQMILDEVDDLHYVKGLMTVLSHKNGTGRCAEVARKMSGYELIINVQGDEAFINVSLVRKFILQMNDEPNIELATLCCPIAKDELSLRSVVKCIVNQDGYAIDFLRVIDMQLNYTVRHHVGVYGYRRDVLLTLVDLKPTENELNRSLEQMRWLDNGYKIKAISGQGRNHSIDTYDDIDEAHRLIQIEKP